MTDTTPLSTRELEILELLAQGKSNKEIAADLVISVNTVKVHISNIFQKTNTSSRSEAIVYAVEHGLVESLRQETPEPQIITEFIEAEEPKWLIWLRKFWWLVVIGFIVSVIALSVILSRSSLLAEPTPEPDPLQNIITQNRWESLESLNPARTGIASVAWRSQIFAIGGKSLEGVSALNQSFSIRTNRWAQHAPKPTPVMNASAVEYNGKIYVFGGECADGTIFSGLEVYDIAKDNWETKASAPLGLSRYATTIFEGKIYILGGGDSKALSAKTLIYDINLDKWAVGTPSPHAFADAFAVTATDHIMLTGGVQSDGDSLQDITSLKILSPSPDEPENIVWSEPLDAFDADKILTMQDLGDSIVVFSVLEDKSVLISYYSAQTETWMHAVENSQVSLPHKCAFANQSGAVYFIGGQDETGQLSEHFVRYQALFTIMLPAIIN
jgi:DNA-binding CsgD family transcriptional regulator/N-acetylneuraminic acid mutarotase